MYYHEINGDLFTIDHNEYVYAHCISADFALGAGIAKQFDKRFNLRNILKTDFSDYSVDYYRYLQEPGFCIYEPKSRTLNLVTKTLYYMKPSFLSLGNALRYMRLLCINHGITKVAMPMIGSGLDKLYWPRVLRLIHTVFDDTDIEILVCIYRPKNN